MAWKKQRTTVSVRVDTDLDDFSEEQMLQGLIDAGWITENEAEVITARKAADDKRTAIKIAGDEDELQEARDNLRRGNKSEAFIHLERFLGREWSGLLQ